MKIKTSELTSAALGFAVKKALGDIGIIVMRDGKWLAYEEGKHHYADDWAQGGPIIDKYDIDVMRDVHTSNGKFVARLGEPVLRLKQGVKDWCFRRAHTKLVAAMRCFVASKLGDEVDVPEELL